MTTWKKMLTEAMASNDECWDDVAGHTPLGMNFDEEFDAAWGYAEGQAFTLWTEQRVYFPVEYDGSEWVESVPRNPCDKPARHIGSA